MLSSEFRDWTSRFRWQQNRFSILLSVLRHRLPLEQYRGLLRILHIVGRLCHRVRVTGDFERIWIRELNSELDSLFAGLEVGEFSQDRLSRLVHLYRDLVNKETGVGRQLTSDACPHLLFKRRVS